MHEIINQTTNNLSVLNVHAYHNNYYLSHSYSIWHGTDNKIGLRLSVCVCVCLSVCLSVCHHSHGRISLSIFTKFDTEV